MDRPPPQGQSKPPAPGGPTQVTGATFAWTQTAPPLPVLGPIDTQTNAEGDVVSLTVPVASPGSGVTFAALNLPSGLNVNQQTGEISGVIDYQASELALRQYATNDIAAYALRR